MSFDPVTMIVNPLSDVLWVFYNIMFLLLRGILFKTPFLFVCAMGLLIDVTCIKISGKDPGLFLWMTDTQYIKETVAIIWITFVIYTICIKK